MSLKWIGPAQYRLASWMRSQKRSAKNMPASMGTGQVLLNLWNSSRCVFQGAALVIARRSRARQIGARAPMARGRLISGQNSAGRVG